MDHRSDRPSPLLVNHLSSLPRGRALDIASGWGRNALYLAANGYEVEGFDRDEAAVAHCNREAVRRGLSFSAVCADLEEIVPFSPRRYALAVCFYYLDRALLPEMKSALQTGGKIVYETFLIDQHRRFGKPSRTAFCWGHNELLHAFSDFRVHFYYEGEIPVEGGGSRWVAQLIAERTA